MCACSLLRGLLDVLFSLKEKALLDSLIFRGQRHVCVLVLFTIDLQLSFFSFRRGLDHEGLSFKERKVDLRKSPSRPFS